jgi:hypothetical protein
MKSPKIADDWEPYLEEKRAVQVRLTAELQAAEAELNDLVNKPKV